MGGLSVTPHDVAQIVVATLSIIGGMIAVGRVQVRLAATLTQKMSEMLVQSREEEAAFRRSIVATQERIAEILENHLSEIGAGLAVIQDGIVHQKADLREHRERENEAFQRIVESLGSISSSLALMQGKLLDAVLKETGGRM